jgi:autotransporter translocation and assembly factor TamB
MRALRRVLQVVALVGTLMVGIVAIALIVSQTPWFRDWIRRYIVRESKQYLNGELSIGHIGGNLLFGVNVSDIAVDVSGERVVAAKNVQVDYSIFELISKGIVLNEIKLVEPVVRLERDGNGWNLGRLVKKQEKEAEREGPRAPISLQSIEIADASVIIDDRVGTSGYRLPKQIDDIDLKASYEYAPVHYSLVVDRASLRTSTPQLDLKELTGKLAVRDDNLYVDKMSIRTAESSMTIDGVIEDYLNTPVVKLTTTGAASLPEISRVVTSVSGYNLHPRFDVKAAGPAENLQLDVDVQSEAGNARARLTADVKAPQFSTRGALDVERLNLEPLLKNPAQRSDITGHADVDVQVADSPESTPIFDRTRGNFTFAGPTVVAAGYRASGVKVTGSLQNGRINLDGRAAAYGGTATARGFIVTPTERQPLAFDLRGKADDVDLRGLPAQTGVPKLATDLSVAEYHIIGEGGVISGSAQLNRSTVEGATFADGMTAEFKTSPDGTSYAARGSVTDLNLPRIGQAMDIPALDKPAYDGRINGDFDVKGTVPPASAPRHTVRASAARPTSDRVESVRATAGKRTANPVRTEVGTTGSARTASARTKVGTANDRLASMTLDATGTLRDSTIMGGRLPQLGFDAHLANGGLTGSADGRFEGFNPATLSGRQEVEGQVTGTLKVNAGIRDITAPITPESITADGTVSLEQSDIGGVHIDTANVDGKYAAQVADLTRLQVTGPDLKVDASGRMALDRASNSDLKYHVDATNLPKLARLAGQTDVMGSAVVDGTVTGNAASLQLSGKLDGSNLGSGKNTALDLNSTYTVTVPELTFKQARVEADTSATLLKLGALEINAAAAKAAYANETLTFTTSLKEQQRELEASGEVILHPDHQEVHLPQLSIRTQGVEWKTVPAAPDQAATRNVATVKYGQDRIELENVRLVSGDQSLEVEGAFALKGEAPAGDIKVVAQNVDLQQLETLMLTDRGLGGRLSANATIKGTMEAPAVDGHIEVRNGKFRNYQYQSLNANLEYVGTRVGIDATLQQSPTESITAKGTVPTSLFKPSPTGGHIPESETDRVDLHVTSSGLGLGVVQGFTDQITNVTGTIDVDVHVTGSGLDPHLQGFVDIKGGGFGFPAGGTSYTGLDTRIELASDRLRFQKFTILDNDHQPLNVSGELAMHAREVGAVNINIDSDNFELIDNELGDVDADSNLTVTGELRRPVVKGRVKLEAARLEVDKILQLFYDPYSVEELPPVVSAERSAEVSGSAEEATAAALRKAQTTAAVPGTQAQAEAAKAPAPGGGAFAPVELALRLEIPENLVLRGKKLRPGGPTGASVGDINITVGGDVQIVKPAGGQVLLLGTVETVRGTYDFQGRRFELVRGGTVRFTGEPQPNPSLDITATRVIPSTGVEARIRIQGTARAPQLSLSSTPPLDESDILSLIVFNRPVNELGTGERASLAATAGGIATGFVAAPLGESIGRALDLDLFEITTTTEEGDLGAGLTLGQQIGDKAFFKMRQQFGDRNVTEFLLDYQLVRFLRVQTTAAPETSGSANRIGQRRVERAGIDLIFVFSY